jgi:hypothetical protein
VEGEGATVSDFKADLEAKADMLVGRRIRRVRYEAYEYQNWRAFGSGIDVNLDGVLLDLDDDSTVLLTWSNECGDGFGLSIVPGRHWADGPPEDWAKSTQVVDVSAQTGWSDVLGQRVTESRIVWHTQLVEQVPPERIVGEGDDTQIEFSRKSLLSMATVPQELVLRFDSGRLVIVSAARYQPERNGFQGDLDEVVVVHDEAIARQYKLGPFSAEEAKH